MFKLFLKLFVGILCVCMTLFACQPIDKEVKVDCENQSQNSDALCPPRVKPACEKTAQQAEKTKKAVNKDSSAFSSFDEADAIEIVESPATGVALGWGWNRGDSEPIPTICIEFVPGEEPAQTRYMTMSEVNDSYELMQSVGMSAEASVKAIGYEAEGKASFAKSQKLTGSKSHFVMNAIVQNGVRYASPLPAEDSQALRYQSATNERGGTSGSIRLTDEAARIAQSNIDMFRRNCGSSFVSAIYGGAKLTAMISMQASSKEDKEKLSAEMSGSGWGVKVKAKVEAESKVTSGSESMDVSIFMTGGKGDAIPVDVKDLKAKMETISMDAYVAPKDFQIAITPYELLSNWPGKPLPDKETEFEELASYWGAYNTLYNDFQLVLDEPEKFVQISVDSTGSYLPKFCLPKHGEYDKASQALHTVTAEYNAINSKYNTYLKNAERFKSPESKLKALKAAQDLIPERAEKATALSAQQGLTQTAKADLATCTAQLNKGISFDAEYREQLKRAQDEVLLGLKKLEEEARVCSDKSDTCDFVAANYRNPYAFRVQLPVPVNSGLATFNDVVDYQFGNLAKRRCDVSANDTACLSNKDIDSWAQKMGLLSINKEHQAEAFEKNVPKVTEDKLKKIPAGVAVMETCRDDILWVNPNAKVEFNVGG